MKLWETYAHAFLEVAPSKILGALNGKNELPDLWKRLSSSPAEGEPDRFIFRHPISGKEKPLEKLTSLWFNSRGRRETLLGALEKAEKKVAEELESAGSMEEFAKLWNGLPEMLRKAYEEELESAGIENAPLLAEELLHFPADPLVPDHDWLSRLDVYAVLRAGGAKLVRFKLSPVQGFIGNARSERDLWAGSHMLSLLTYLAVSKLWRAAGPNALIFPHLRGQPFFEHEIGELKKKDSLDVANMPNKVLAIVPWDVDVEKLAGEIEDGIRDFMERLFNSAWEFYGLTGSFEKEEIYGKTVRGYFSITVEEVPLSEVEVIEVNLRKYLESLPDGFESEVHHYPELFSILDQLTDFKSAEHFPPEQPLGHKCTLCGENLAIGGGGDFSTLREKWDSLRERLRDRGIYDIKDKEHLCPLCLSKRFYPRFYALWKEDYRVLGRDCRTIAKEAGKVELRRFASVSEVAMRRPTEKAWELFERNELKTESGPVTWYDVFEYLVLHTGSRDEWRGKREKPSFGVEFEKHLMELASALMPLFKHLGPNSEVLYAENLSSKVSIAKVYGVKEEHLPAGVSPGGIKDSLSEVVGKLGEPPKYYALLKMDGDNMGKVISGSKGVKSVGEYTLAGRKNDVPRPATPMVHVAITRSLSNFAVHFVPEIVGKRKGELLYAGGDDVMALAPTHSVFTLAKEIWETFREDWKDFTYLQGGTRSMSAGVLITHYKEPLYVAVKRVGELEHMAKESGRNALAIGYLKHSGSYYRVAVNWGAIDGNLPHLLDAIRSGKLSRKLVYEFDTATWPNEPLAVLNLVKYEFERHSHYSRDEKEELQERLAEFLWLARNVRVVLSAEELEELGVNPEKGGEINEAIRKVIVDDPEKDEPMDSFEDILKGVGVLFDHGEPKLWSSSLVKKIKCKFGKEGTTAKEAEEMARSIAGLVLKKQVAGAAVLLKVFLEAGVRE
ncbi:type III-B CRISPR-associated protein Cas10/Cmr2 [Thermococcus sp. JdF3]|uniref:type III-B CRISPR-associated protein Cas10/Cmr2 n=1 Tax=Thermococcus sp. JdF3 TaxID=1638258 RepID=UPI00143B619A|nr:type III-B CRISPR-associated protein Cas10/Cmr2 [Thermococcus sp. JdF3]NJE01394.1 type III-B CRISPR-associated protein Cas10/Cmr2 [Thermococcus sp. JdF3]